MENNNDIIGDITRYTEFLRGCGYEVSLCNFDAALSRYYPVLLRYEVHLPLICSYMKSNPKTAGKCAENKRRLKSRMPQSCRFGCCYAGVCEYVFPVKSGEKCVAAVNVSGYRDGSAAAEKQRRFLSRRIGAEYDALYNGLSVNIPGEEIIKSICASYNYMFSALYKQCVDSPEPEDEAGAIYHRTLDYIYNNYMNRIGAADIAAALNYSESYLRHVFRSRAGETIGSFLCRTRLRNAAELLLKTRLSVTRIAGECGFSDANYFSTVFGAKYGISPTKYRRMNGNEAVRTDLC